MSCSWVVNASLLIVLGKLGGKLGQLHLLPMLALNLNMPESVRREILAGPPNDHAAALIQRDRFPAAGLYLNPALIKSALALVQE